METDKGRTWSLRPVEPTEAARLSELARGTFLATFGHLYRPDDLNTFLAASYSEARQQAEIDDPANQILVAEAGDDWLGYCHAGAMGLPFDPGTRPCRELKRLYVVEAAKGQGIADALMAETITWAIRLGTEDLYLGVYADNHRAQAFYRRHGFETVGRYTFMVGTHEDDERIMRKVLG